RKRGCNVIRASRYRLPSRTTVSRGDVVPRQEPAATAGRQRIRIRIAVGLAVGISRPCGSLRVDRKGRAGVRNVVVAQYRSWTQRGGDVIGPASYRFSGGPAVSRRDIIGRREPTAAASSQGIS